MEPTNNPTSTSNPTSGPVPGAMSSPSPVPASTSGVDQDFVSMGTPAAGGTAATPSASGAGSAMPNMGATPSPVSSTPVNPVAQPGVGTNPVYQPGQNIGVAATDPIMMPEPAPEPDPVEEELKAPMKAAEPVPGSIGSAVSMPSGGVSDGDNGATMPAENPFAAAPKANTPSVSFTDPATQPDVNSSMQGAAPVPTKKKTDKKTLIILIAVALVVVVILAIVLIMQLVGGGDSGKAVNPPAIAENTDNDPENSPENNPSGGGGAGSDELIESTLSCTRSMTAEELLSYNGAVSGTVSVTANFVDEYLDTLSLSKSVMYGDGAAANTDEIAANGTMTDGAVQVSSQQIDAAGLKTGGGVDFELTTEVDGEDGLMLNSVQANYENLAYICEVL